MHFHLIVYKTILNMVPNHAAHTSGTPYDAVFIIPAYREGDGILPLLESIALQQGISGTRLAVFVVINNGKTAPASVRESNYKTHDLLEHLQQGKIPHTSRDTRIIILGDPIYPPHLPEKQCRTIIDTGLPIHIVDAWNNGNDSDWNNVGSARDLGCQEALRYIKDDGIVLLSDADCVLDDSYVEGALSYFQAHPNIDACSARLVNFQSENLRFEEILEQDRHEKLQQAINSLQRVQGTILQQRINRQKEETENSHQNMMSGASMTIRAEVLRSLRFRHIPGGEDLLFATDMIRQGYRIGFCEEMLVSTEARASDRTDPECGYGQSIIRERKYAKDFGAIPVDSLPCLFFQKELSDFCDENLPHLFCEESVLRPRVNEVLMRFRTTQCLIQKAPDLSRTEIDFICDALLTAPTMTVPSKNWIVSQYIRSISQERYPQMPLASALSEAEDECIKQFPPSTSGFIRNFSQESVGAAFCLRMACERFIETTLALNQEIPSAPPGLREVVRLNCGLPFGNDKTNEMLSLRAESLLMTQTLGMNYCEMDAIRKLYNIRENDPIILCFGKMIKAEFACNLMIRNLEGLKGLAEENAQEMLEIIQKALEPYCKEIRNGLEEVQQLLEAREDEDLAGRSWLKKNYENATAMWLKYTRDLHIVVEDMVVHEDVAEGEEDYETADLPCKRKIEICNWYRRNSE